LTRLKYTFIELLYGTAVSTFMRRLFMTVHRGQSHTRHTEVVKQTMVIAGSFLTNPTPTE